MWWTSPMLDHMFVFLMALLQSFMAIRQNKMSARQHELKSAVQEIHVIINSRLTEISAGMRAEGNLQGRAEQTAEIRDALVDKLVATNNVASPHSHAR